MRDLAENGILFHVQGPAKERLSPLEPFPRGV